MTTMARDRGVGLKTGRQCAPIPGSIQYYIISTGLHKFARNSDTAFTETKTPACHFANRVPLIATAALFVGVFPSL